MDNFKTKGSSFKFLNLLAMLYVTFFLLSAVLANRLVLYGHTMGSAATLIFPLTYLTSDIVAEVYGYKFARQLIWFGMLCEFLFGLLSHYLIKMPHPSSFHHVHDYNVVMSPLLRMTLASFVATMVGSFTNIYLLTKWKIALRGKYFWVRSLVSSTIGELLFTVIADLIIFYGHISSHGLIQIMYTSYIFKLIFSPIAVIPASGCVLLLRHIEKLGIEEPGINYNPFSVKV